MNSSSPPHVMILGGRSFVAPYLLSRLAEAGFDGSVTSRQLLSLPEGFKAIKLNLDAPGAWQAPADSVVISLLPIWIFADHLDLFDKAKAVIALGSTSRFGKAASDDPHELEVVRKLETAEKKLENWAREQGVPFTILRPTLIYDGKNDVNITRIAAMIRRFGTVPIAAPGKGLRQPIHADDVAKAIMGAIDNSQAAGRAFNIAGGEVLTYREMIRRIDEAMLSHAPLPQRWLPCPLFFPVWFLKSLFRAATALGLLRERHFGFAVFQRMNEDLVFDAEEGLKILAYAPKPFRP